MSWLSSGLKKVGKVAKKVAPFAGLIPGVGTVAGAAIGGLGSLAAGDGLGGALKNAAIGGLSGYGGGKLLGGKGILGLGGGLKKIGSAVGIGGKPSLSGSPGDLIGHASEGVGDPGTMPGSSGGHGIGGFVGGLLGGSDGKLGLSDVGGFLSGGLKKLGGVDGLLGAGALGYGAYQQKQAGDYRNKALKLIEQDYASRAPLRSQGLAGMLNETPPDLSQTFAPASQNPFAVRRVA